MDTNDQVNTDTQETVEQAESTDVPQEQPAQPDYESRIKELESVVADLTGKLKRATKKDSPSSEGQKKQSDELDYGMKAYLRSEGIEPTEFEWVNDQKRQSGLPLEQLLSNGYFQSELKSRRDQKAVEKAVPSQTRGVTESAKNQVDYWVQKGEMPPNTPDNFELRTQVLNRRIEVERTTRGFSPNPVVMQ